MAWKAELRAITNDNTNGNMLVEINYTDGAGGNTTQVLPGNDINDDRIILQAELACTMLDARDAARSAITLKPGAIPRMSQANKDAREAQRASQLARATLENSARILSGLKVLVDTGVMAADDPVYLAAHDNAKSAATSVQASGSKDVALLKP